MILKSVMSRVFALSIAWMSLSCGAWSASAQETSAQETSTRDTSTQKTVAQEPSTQATSQPAVTPCRVNGFEDHAKFTVLKNEDPIAFVESEWKPDGSFTNESRITIGGQSITKTLRVTPDADGFWQTITVETPRGTVSVERSGASAAVRFGEKSNTVELSSGAVLYENLTPALFNLFVRQYDRAAGGVQTIPVFVIPQAVIDVTLEYLDSVERAINGVDRTFLRYKCSFPGVEITLWADEHAIVYMTEVPQQYATIVREGYETLRKPSAADPHLSQPQYEVTLESNVMVPMRDGVALATDIYRPQAEGRFPVILTRTPYKKDMFEHKCRFFARRGYVVAAQDCRGRFGSQGQWEPFLHEAEDGYDAIEWLAAQPWSTGKTGMIGASYGGWVQWMAASRKPPHLTAIIPNVSPPDPAYNFPYEYGVFMLRGMFWMDVVDSEATADLSGAAMEKIGDKDASTLFRHLPVIDLDEVVLGKRSAYWREWVQHPPEDDYWEPVNFLDRLKEVPIPAFHQSGWYDGDGIGTKLNYARMVSYGHPNQKLVVGPWGHTDTASRTLGALDFGPAAIVDLQTQYLRWFDYWLKGVDNGILKEPLVSIFVMGSNQWLNGDAYPLPGTRLEKWYLTSAGDANTLAGSGRLTTQPPAEDCPPDKYKYDPGDPTPDSMFAAAEKSDSADDDEKSEAGSRHDALANERLDLLVYQTEPLTEPMTIAGPLSMVLYASTSARDTDWFARLYMIPTEGDSQPLSVFGGKIRARYREGIHKPKLLQPGRVYEYQIDLWHSAITIPTGARLRLEISSAGFPVFSRNLNTGGNNELETEYVIAEQAIYHNTDNPSYVLLPIVPQERLKEK